jgi:radical SAM family uncharacterized protein
MRHPIFDLHLLEKPGRYLGRERNSVLKENPEKLLRFALVYPEIYEIGLSNLGLKILYHILNQDKRVWAERAYLPWIDAEEYMREKRIPLFTLESYTPLKNMDVVGISLQTELNDTNALKVLELSEIPIKSDERRERDPIIIGGGPRALNPLPLSRFFDAFVIGEGEEVIMEMVEPLLEWKGRIIKREVLLEKLSEIEGVYVPKYPKERVKRRFAPLSYNYFPTKQIVPHIEIVHDRLSIEIMRGCTRGCRFCQAGIAYRPPRIRQPEEIVQLAEKGLRETGWDEMGLLAFTVSDYPNLVELLISLKRRIPNVHISLPSLPVDALSDEILDVFKELRRFGLTLAPETYSQRLRDIINKNVPLQVIYRTIELAERYGWRNIKLYFMLGLPGEREEDVRELARFLKDIHRFSKRVVFKTSINTFVPKPHTPFEWASQKSPEEMRHLISVLKDDMGKLPRIKLRWRSPEKSMIEGILGRGGEELSDVIELVYRRSGFFQDRSEFFDYNRWIRAFKELGIDPNHYLKGRDLKEHLPWDFIDPGVSKNFLRREWEKSIRGETTPDCMRRGCQGCGPWIREGYITCKRGLQIKRVEHPHLVKEGEEPRKYAFRYSIKGEMKFLGHNNIIKILTRAMGRAEIPLRYSKGYVPKPRISMGPSLPFGVESEVEWIVFETKFPIDLSHKVNSLNMELPEGIEIEEFFEIRRKPEWNKILGARYCIPLKHINEEKIGKKKGMHIRENMLYFDIPFGKGTGFFQYLSEILKEGEEIGKIPIRRVALLEEGGIFSLKP